ncbi:PREDICTED: protein DETOXIFICATION 12-like isoform X2 [Camelina sativa]|uniref:Protein DETOXIFICATION 12-like isoform X2 n=1 Tax=Camelina sativa TaxID=90675 RepID=A0ABM0XNJ8_CAMSA|nr:PREDICTED: protein DETOXIFICATION 12-like isoform X2 [Camelina sativa]XP_010488555.1 PREDICTED: protein DETOXIFICATION 12-like isoform X2 [Camelina sativa]
MNTLEKEISPRRLRDSIRSELIRSKVKSLFDDAKSSTPVSVSKNCTNLNVACKRLALPLYNLLSNQSGNQSVNSFLSGQAFGAKLYRKLDVQTYTAMFCLALVCIPLSLVWLNMEKLLVFLGQDPAAWLIPGLFAYSVLQPFTRFFQNQSLLTAVHKDYFRVVNSRDCTCMMVLFGY